MPLLEPQLYEVRFLGITRVHIAVVIDTSPLTHINVLKLRLIDQVLSMSINTAESDK